MTSTDPTTTICTGETLTDGYWLWSLIATSWLSGTGTIINGSLLFFFACRRMSKSSRILRNGYCSNNAFIVTLFVSQLLVTCIVVPYRISQMTGAAYRCEGIPSMNGFINALMVVPRVTNGVIAYDRYKSSTTTTFAKVCMFWILYVACYNNVWIPLRRNHENLAWIIIPSGIGIFKIFRCAGIGILHSFFIWHGVSIIIESQPFF